MYIKPLSSAYGILLIYFKYGHRHKKTAITGRIYAKTFELLEEHFEGLHRSNLISKIEESDRSFYPKTVNSCGA